MIDFEALNLYLDSLLPSFIYGPLALLSNRVRAEFGFWVPPGIWLTVVALVLAVAGYAQYRRRKGSVAPDSR